MLLDKIVNEAEHYLYTLIDDYYYIDPEKQLVESTELESTECRSILQDILGDWTLTESGIWITATPIGQELPGQGFKIHISTFSFDDLTTCLKKITPICRSLQIKFKVVRNSFFFNYLSSKNCPPQWAYKFITIYPHDQRSQSLTHLTSILKNALLQEQEIDSPDILTDTKIANSPLYYRYGSFNQAAELQEDGTKVQYLNIDGEKIADYTTRLPKNVIDPFSQQQDHTTEEEEDTELLNYRYDVLDVINMTAHGAVYKAIDMKTNEKVAIKHALPFRGGDLTQEEVILRHLTENNCVAAPKLIDVFCINNCINNTDGGIFLVQDFIEGTPLYEILQTPQKVENMISIMILIARALKNIHDNEVVHGDLSPSNIIISDEGTVYIIDYESSYILPHTREIFSGTPSYTPKNRTGTLSDDIYSMGAVFFYCLFGFPPFIQNYKNLLKRRNDVDPSIKSLIIKSLDPGNRPTIKQAVQILDNNKNINRMCQPSKHNTLKEKKIASTVEALMRGLNSSRNTETIYYGTPEAFLTNPLSYGWGSAGIIYARCTCDSKYDAYEDVKCILNHPSLNTTEMPPGIASGLAGIALVLNEIGYQDDARKILLQATSHPMILEERISLNLNHGLTGVGMACLHVAGNIDDTENKFMDTAIDIRDRILNNIPEGEITADMCLFLSKFQEDNTYVNIVEDTIHDLLSKPVSTIEECLNLIRLICNHNENKYRDNCSQLINYLFQNNLSYRSRTLLVILDLILDAKDTFNDHLDHLQKSSLIVAQRITDITMEAPNGASFIPGEDLSIIRVSPTNSAMAALILNRSLQDNLAESKKSSPYFFI